MEDRYLFKAKRVDNGEWVIGFYVRVNESDFIYTGQLIHGGLYTVSESFKVDPSTICQCTGLKDKNGNLIWENDFVKCVDENNDIEFTAIIKVGMKETGVTCEVIGNKFNKFDNPELRL